MPPNKAPNAEGTVSQQSWERRSERRVHLSEAAEIMQHSAYGLPSLTICWTSENAVDPKFAGYFGQKRVALPPG